MGNEPWAIDSMCEDYLIPNLHSSAWHSLHGPQFFAGWGKHCSFPGFLRKRSQFSHCWVVGVKVATDTLHVRLIRPNQQSLEQQTLCLPLAWSSTSSFSSRCPGDCEPGWDLWHLMSTQALCWHQLIGHPHLSMLASGVNFLYQIRLTSKFLFILLVDLMRHSS